MPKLDPRDVLPQSNLPVPSVPWGRAMQARLQGVEERVLIDKQDIDGQNRTTAAQLAAISEQLTRINSIANRLYETNDFRIYEDTLDSNSSGTVGTVEMTAPSWAIQGVVTVSFGNEDGAGGPTTSRVATYSVDVVTSDSPTQGQRIVRAGSATFTGDHWTPTGRSDSVAVGRGRVEAYINRNVTTNGTGTIFPHIIVMVTWYGIPIDDELRLAGSASWPSNDFYEDIEI